MPRKKKPVDWSKKLDSYFIAFCRKLYQWSPQRKGALAIAFVTKSPGGVRLYRCAECRELTAEPKIDHIVPVCPTNKPWDRCWNTYRDRLFGGYVQCLCKDCHDKKTARENRERRKNRE